VCAENGDFVSAASDRVARIFSRDKIRQGDPKIIQALDDSVKSSSIPQQQVGEVNKEKLPGPEFLTQKSGTKEGQVVMIREADGSVTAHTWSQGAGSWVNVGTVVDAVGSSGKKVGYKGKDYDYVFNVDIEDGKPALKLPYNLSQNPYDAATKFIQDNELPMSYLDEVANFITSNTQGAAVGQNTQSPVSQQPGSDPWGSESRYRPGEISPATSHLPSSSRPKILPQTKYLSIAAANLKTIQKKIEELNIQLSEEGSHDIALSPLQVETLRQLTAHLDPSPTQNPPSPDTLASSLTIIITILTTWPVALHLPALDLLRLLSATTPAAATFRTPSQATIIDTLATSGTFSDTSLPNNAMLATRALANLFETAPGRALVDGAYDAIFKLVSAAYTGAGTANRNLTIAVTTLGINYAVLCTSASHRELPSSMDRGLALLEMLIGILGREKDAEAVYRALVGVGTWLGLGEEMALAAKEVFGLEEALKKVEGGVREPRIKAVVGEIRALVGMVSA
jgi:phospholipase A-2-activating protein